MMTPEMTSEGWPVVLKTCPAFNMSDDQFFEFCQQNRDWRIERTGEGELIIMPPAGGETGDKNAFVTAFLKIWSLQDERGVVFDSSTGFILPNRATRSPDAAWVERSRLRAFTPAQKKKFLPLCPDFVLELRSPSDTLKTVQEKMREYLDNGARLGWLIDPAERRVYIYRPGVATECLDNPTTISGNPELPGFVLDLSRIWEANF
jgi:Uma2 family endonuclease